MQRSTMVGFASVFLVLGGPVVLHGQERAETAPSASQPPAPPSEVVLADTIWVVARAAPWDGCRFTLLSLRPASRGFDSEPLLSPYLSGPRLQTVRLSRFACTAYGADRGANAGLFLGGLGNLTGLWDEKTAFYLMGAGAALGALWGGSAGAEDPAFRVRVEFEDP